MTENTPADASPRRPSLTREDWNRRYEGTELVWSVTPNKTFAQETADLAPGAALDLGAGEGRHAVWLAEQGWRVHAVDFSDVAIDKARRLAEARGVADRVRFEIADLTAYAPEPGRYDLVAMIYFHIAREELAPALQRAAQAVAPGGLFLLIAHDSENLEHGHGGPQRAEVLYTADFVAPIVGETLEIEKAERIERRVKIEGAADATALDCLVRARRPATP